MTTESKVILLQQFRTRYPDWTIDSKVVKTDGAIVIQATVLDLDGKVRSSGHGSVAFQSAGFDTDLAEQAEDSAIERCLIHLFGGDDPVSDPPPVAPTDDDDGTGDINAGKSSTNAPGKPTESSHGAGTTQNSQQYAAVPYLAGDPASRRRVRTGMQQGGARNYITDGTVGVPPVRVHRRPTGT